MGSKRIEDRASGSSVRLEHEKEHRIRTEEELRKSVASLAEAQRIAHLGNWDWSIADNELWWSDEIYRIFGLDRRNFGATYEAFLNSVHPDDREFVQASVSKAVENEESYDIDHRIVLPDGTERVVHEQAKVFRDDSGRAVRMLGTVQDITEQKLDEQTLAQRRKALEAVYRISTATGISMESMCDRVAESLSELLDVPHVVVRRHDAGKVELIAWAAESELKHDGSFEIACGPCGKVCREAESYQFQGSLKEMFSNSICLNKYDLKSYIGVPVTSGDGIVIGILCAMDYRERAFSEDEVQLLEIFARYVGHEIERDVMEQELQLSQRMKVLGQLASGVAHEVRNPLNAILAISEALNLDLGESPEHSEYIDQIRMQVQRLSKLMQDLLDLGKPILEASMQKESLVGICSSAVNIWTRSTARKERVVRFEKPEGDDGLFVVGDSVRLQQVLINLLENAAQHSSEDGEITLAVSGPARGMLTIRVTDAGEGLDPGSLDKVFEPFYTTRKGGTGLGLSIVRHIVETHGGAISIGNNEPPPGCTVTVSLPAAKE